MNYDDRIFPDPFPPDCATAWGDDRFGLWFDFEIGGVTQRMRWIEPGTFWMGSSEDECGYDSDEGPRHLVVLTQGFWLADTACTRAFWAAVAGYDLSHFRFDIELPVERVSWDQINEDFIPALQNALPDMNVRLPTESQWEYSCRAGQQTAYSFGFNITKAQANFDTNTTLPVKSRPANKWGLYQMHGNVWEWCEGNSREYSAGVAEDPPDDKHEVVRVLRGGAWDKPAEECRSASRKKSHKIDRSNSGGFRFSLWSIKSQ